MQALCSRLDFMHIYAQRKLTFISKISRLNNNVMKACFDNFCRSDESMRLHCEFDISVGAPADDIRDAVFNNFYSIAIMKQMYLYYFFSFTLLYCKILYCIVSSYFSLFLYCIFVCFLPMWRINVFNRNKITV